MKADKEIVPPKLPEDPEETADIIASIMAT
jgi:hypothetical protein